MKYKCVNCKREKETTEKLKLVLCSCGYEMEELKEFTPQEKKNLEDIRKFLDEIGF